MRAVRPEAVELRLALVEPQIRDYAAAAARARQAHIVIFKNFWMLKNYCNPFSGSERRSSFFFELLYCFVGNSPKHGFAIFNIEGEIRERFRDFYAVCGFKLGKI